MQQFEIPLGKRTRKYRFFEMLPAIISYGAFILLIVLSLVSPLLAAIYLLLIVITVAVKAAGIVFHTIVGHNRLQQVQKIDWKTWLGEFEDPIGSYDKYKNSNSRRYGFREHKDNLRLAAADPAAFPRPSELYNLVIVAAYNESYEVLEPTIQSVFDTTYDNDKLIVVLAYEERGGEAIEATAQRLQKKFASKFGDFILVKHPNGLPNEILTGKGGNITYAGKYMQEWFKNKGIEYKHVLVTTLDSDNRPHKSYFDYMTYEYVINENRKHLAYQPIALFINNIWDVPAPMRVVATGNTFWNIISAMRPHTMRNFASHSQPMEALVEMGFWSTRTIVEDGHQFWRSYFHFSGNYSVTPLYIPIYQDAVLDDTYIKTLKAQFIQLRRWMYGASDIAYIAVNLFTSKRTVPFLPGLVWFIRALDGYVTAASVPLIVALGGWIPLLINNQAYHNVVAHQLPEAVSVVQQIVLLGLLVMVFLAFKMLPPRPERYKRRRTVWMVLQWGLMPLTTVTYLSLSALNAQARLFFGRYLVKFDVTAKATVASRDQARRQREKSKAAAIK